MPTSPIVANMDTLSYKIKVGGSEIPSDILVTSIETHQAVNRIAHAKVDITLIKGDGDDITFQPSESATFVPGAEIEIELGYEGTDTTVFKGIIVNHSIQGNPSVSKLVLKCTDKAIKMTLGRSSKSYDKQKDNAIISSVISNHGLSAEVDSTNYEHPQLIQYHATDWDFVIARAEVNGLLVYTDSNTVYAKAPNVSGSPSLELSYGKDVFSFDCEIDSRFQIPSATAHAWDMSQQSLSEGASAEPSLNSQGNITGKKLSEVLGISQYEIHTTGPVAQSDLTEWAKGTLLRSRLSAMHGTVSFFGNASPKVNTLIKLQDFGDRFNGDALITGVHHKMENGKWRTSIDFGVSPHWFAADPMISTPLTGGLLPSIRGLQNGTVKKIYQDPDGETRIQVDVPVIESLGDGVWARIANFYATSDKGAFFMPEVGDEVVLGFLNDDPRFPVILGSLYSSQKNPPYTPDEQNSIKAIVTKNDLKLEFNDEKKVITIETPAGNKMIFSDEGSSITIQDQNENKIEMSSSGISIKSPSNISIEADQAITIKGNTGVTIQSQASATLKGLSVSVEAETTLQAKGTASAQLTSTGETTIRGTMVMIN